MILPNTFGLVLTASDADSLEFGKNHFARGFSMHFGGAMVLDGTGWWTDPELDQEVVEPNALVLAFTDKSPEEAYRIVKDEMHLDDWLQEEGQKAVALIANGHMYIYDTGDLPEFLR